MQERLLATRQLPDEKALQVEIQICFVMKAETFFYFRAQGPAMKHRKVFCLGYSKRHRYP